MCPRVPEEISSARRQLTAATSSSELPSETPVFPQTAKWAGRLSTISYCKFCCLLLLPHLISSCSKERDYYLSTVKRGHWKRQRVRHRANTNQGMHKKLISLQLLLCTKPCFRMNPSVHRRAFFPSSWQLTPSLWPWGGRQGLTGVPPCEGSDAQPPSHSGRFLLGRGAALLSQLLIRRGGHQLSNEDSLQTAIIDAFSQPPPTGEPAAHPGQAQVSPTHSCSLISKLGDSWHPIITANREQFAHREFPQSRALQEQLLHHNWSSLETGKYAKLGSHTYFMIHTSCFLPNYFALATTTDNAAFKSVAMINNQIPTEFPPSWGCGISSSSHTHTSPHNLLLYLWIPYSPNEIHAHVHSPNNFIPCPPIFPYILWPTLRSGAHLSELQSFQSSHF